MFAYRNGRIGIFLIRGYHFVEVNMDNLSTIRALSCELARCVRGGGGEKEEWEKEKGERGKTCEACKSNMSPMC